MYILIYNLIRKEQSTYIINMKLDPGELWFFAHLSMNAWNVL